jgi:hypothetical protein
MLVVAFSTGGSGGPYGNSIQASASVVRGTDRGPTGGTVVEERWQFRTQLGHAIDAKIEYTPGTPTVVDMEDHVHSAAKPDFYRIYRTGQALDALCLPGADRVRRLDFSATGPVLSPLFDGSQRPISVVAVPWYARQVFVPAS